MKKYRVFKYDSRNSGWYVAQDLRLKDARDIAKRLSVTNYPKTRLEGQDEYFTEVYERQEKTEWSNNVKP